MNFVSILLQELLPRGQRELCLTDSLHFAASNSEVLLLETRGKCVYTPASQPLLFSDRWLA